MPEAKEHSIQLETNREEKHILNNLYHRLFKKSLFLWINLFLTESWFKNSKGKFFLFSLSILLKTQKKTKIENALKSPKE